MLSVAGVKYDAFILILYFTCGGRLAFTLIFKKTIPEKEKLVNNMNLAFTYNRFEVHLSLQV